jgi:hypothetical protein
VPSVGVFELILRGIVVYLVLFALLRFIGKKHVGELSPFDGGRSDLRSGLLQGMTARPQEAWEDALIHGGAR